jgi:TldD protein
MPVILGSGWPGVLIHEAVGHGLEADFIRKKSSIYHDKLGELVASPVCTIIDNGCIAGYRGSLGIDDEGEPTQSTTLIENGILKNFLFDRHQAFLMGTVSTGNGRRESALHCPMPRMTNTFLAAGQDSTAAMIESVPYGIYAVNFGGGSVDITSGQFVFSASEAYIIEKGQLKQPIKGATLIGNGPAVLKKISMVGHELRFDPGIGVCGKNGQGVPVTVGQPALKIDEIVVGGTNG